MSKKIVEKIKKAIQSKMTDCNFNPKDVKISIISNKAVVQMTYSITHEREEIKDSDIRKMMKIAKSILKKNEVKVMALSPKRKEAIKNIRIEKRVKKVRFATVKPSYIDIPNF